ncbi:MAG: hypothetical protein AAF664_02190 [Planctomycetota bacterium]
MSTLRIKCPTCDRQLELPVEAAGKVGKCPACDQTFRVPEAEGQNPSQGGPAPVGPNDFGGSGAGGSGAGGFGAGGAGAGGFAGVSPSGAPGGSAAPGSSNPFQAPATTERVAPPVNASNPGQIRPVDFGVIWDVGFAIFKARCVPLIGVFAVGTIGLYLVQLPVSLVVAAIPPVAIITSPILLIIQVVFQLLLARATVRTCQGQNLAFDSIFPPMHNIFRFAGATLLFSIAAMVLVGIPAAIAGIASQGGNGDALAGIAILVVVMLAFTLAFVGTFYAWSAIFVFNEPNVTVSGGIGRAISITNTNKLTVLLLLVASTALTFLGIIACGIGFFVAAPFGLTLFGTAYLLITGQGVSDPRSW